MPRFRKKKKIVQHNVLTLELSLTDLAFGKGGHVSNKKSKQRGGRYHPFCQVTDAHGHILGRSLVLHDCCVSARWPPMKMNWEAMLQRHFNRGQQAATEESSSPATKKRRRVFRREKVANVDLSQFEEVVKRQPVLLTIYDYRNDGSHVVMGKVSTTIHELEQKAEQQLRHVENSKAGHTKEPSFRLLTHTMTKIYVKRLSLSTGRPDVLTQKYFRDAELKHIPAPRGIRATAASTQQQQQLQVGDDNDHGLGIPREVSLHSCSETVDCSLQSDDTESTWSHSPRSLGSSQSSLLSSPLPQIPQLQSSGAATTPHRMERPKSVLRKTSFPRSSIPSMDPQFLTAEMRLKLRRLTELRASSEKGALPPVEAQEFQILTRLLDRLEGEAREEAEQRQMQAKQVKQQKKTLHKSVSLSPAVELQVRLKRMEKVVQMLHSKCVAQGKGGQFKAFLVLLERLEGEARHPSMSQLQRERNRIQHGASLSKLLIDETKIKIERLKEFRSLYPKKPNEEMGDETAASSVATQPALASAAQQCESLTRLLGRLERHEHCLRKELERHKAEQEKQIQHSSLDFLTSAMRTKLKQMESVMQAMCDASSPTREAKYVDSFMTLLDSWEEDEDDEDDEQEDAEGSQVGEKEATSKHAVAQALGGAKLNQSLIHGLSTKLREMESGSSFGDDQEEEEEEDSESSDDEAEEESPLPQKTITQTQENHADVLARVLQRLESHEARRRADAQQRRQATAASVNRFQPPSPMTVSKETSARTSVMACY